MTKSFQTLFGITVPLYVFLIVVEMIWSHFYNRKVYSTKGTIGNIYISTLNFSLDILMRTTCFFVLTFFFGFRFFQIQNTWLYWISLLLAEDLIFYFLHRVDHYCRIFWAVHVTHHNSEEFNLTVGFRSSVFQPLYRFIWFIPLSLFGFQAIDVMFMYSITQIYGILIHTQAIGKLGFLEWFMATPSHHRVHHGSNILYLDKNMGMVFIIWDRMFGTFQEETEKVQFGLTQNIRTAHPVKVVFHEWENIVRDLRKPLPLKIKLMYLLGPPGWSHDGSRKTSVQLRKQFKKNS